jgi:uncharacterized membrane protein YedE/YeeE
MKTNQDPTWKLVLLQLFMASWVAFIGWGLIDSFRSTSVAESLPFIPEQTPLSVKTWLARLFVGAFFFLMLVHVIRSSFTLWRTRSLAAEPIQSATDQRP